MSGESCVHLGRQYRLRVGEGERPSVKLLRGVLCDLVEHNDGKRFYVLLGRVLPDWEARRRRLNEEGAFLRAGQ